MFSSQTLLQRDLTDLPQKLFNKEYVRLTGESPEEAKAADAENDGDAGSGDEAGKKKAESQPLAGAQIAFAGVCEQDR